MSPGAGEGFPAGSPVCGAVAARGLRASRCRSSPVARSLRHGDPRTRFAVSPCWSKAEEGLGGRRAQGERGNAPGVGWVGSSRVLKQSRLLQMFSGTPPSEEGGPLTAEDLVRAPEPLCSWLHAQADSLFSITVPSNVILKRESSLWRLPAGEKHVSSNF